MPENFSYSDTLHRQIANLEQSSAEILKRIKDRNYTPPRDFPRLVECLVRNVVTTERLAQALYYHLNPNAPKSDVKDVKIDLPELVGAASRVED